MIGVRRAPDVGHDRVAVAAVSVSGEHARVHLVGLHPEISKM